MLKSTIVFAKKYYRFRGKVLSFFIADNWAKEFREECRKLPLEVYKQSKSWDYSLNKRKMSVGPLKGKEVFVASAVCQKQCISFD